MTTATKSLEEMTIDELRALHGTLATKITEMDYRYIVRGGKQVFNPRGHKARLQCARIRAILADRIAL